MERMLRDVLRVASFVLFCSAVSFLFTFVPVGALERAPISDLPCDDARLPTEAEVAAGAPAGIKACPSDFQTAIRDDGSAKAFLNSLPKRPLSNAAPPTQENINRLNPSFAICAANFFKAYTDRYGLGSVAVTSAYRSPSANANAGGVPGSNHTRGVAMDVNAVPPETYPRMWQFASANPQFGVCFPFQDGRTGSIYDRPHIILAGIGGSESNLCARQGVTRACDGSNFDPGSIQNISSYAPSPSSDLSNYVRQLFGEQQGVLGSQGAGAGQNCTLPDGNVVPCNAIANQGAQQQPTISPIPGTQQGGGGSSQGTRKTTPITGTSADLSGGTTSQSPDDNSDLRSSLSGTKTLTETILETISKATTSANATNTRKLSTLEQIRIFAAQGTPSTKTQQNTTTPPLVLVVDEASAVTIEEQQSGATTITPQGSTSAYVPFTSQQTFTSPELGGRAFGILPPPQQTTFSPYQQVLMNMQSIVQNMLAYLQPFGRPASHEHTDGHY